MKFFSTVSYSALSSAFTVIFSFSNAAKAAKVVDFTFTNDATTQASNTNQVVQYNLGATIKNFKGYSFDALRIDSEGPHALIKNVDISPGVMPDCTLMVGMYLERIAESNGWVFNQEESGWDRGINVHDGRTFATSGIVRTQTIRSSVGSGSPWEPWNNPQPPPVGEWFHVTATFKQGGDCWVYLNGVQSDNSITGANSVGKPDLWVGTNHWDPNSYGAHYVDGWIRNVKVFDTSLSPAEVFEHTTEFFNSIPSDVQTLPPSIPSTKTPSPTPAPTITGPDRNEWIISTTGNSTEEATSKDTILISTPFNTSNRDHAALVFEANCITPFDNDSYFTIGTTTPTSSAPDGFIQFNTTLEMNVTAINGTSYWKPFTDGTRGGWVEACIETYLQFTDDLNLGNDNAVQKVTFKNNVFNISVSLTATYDVDQVSVVRETAKGENLKTDYSEYIKAYLCADTDPYAAPVTENTYNQGDEITICVTDESGSIVQVEEFVDLVVAQDGVSDYNFIFNTLYNPDITFVDCLDGSSSQRRVCFAKIRALARFFQSTNPSPLTISGSVYVIRDGRRVRRNLRMGLPAPENTNEEEDTALVVSGRRDEEEEEGSGDFEVIASLAASADDSAASSRIVGSAVGGLVSMAVGAAGATLMA